MKGGYKIVSFKNEPLTSGEPATIDGVYSTISNVYGKATMISGMVVGEVAYPDFYAPFVANAGTYETQIVISGATITIRIASGDAVTVTVA